MKAPAVVLEEVSVTYRSKRSRTSQLALDHTTATFESGSFTALVGPTGCGKSTLLNLIAGFVVPASGVVRMDGQPVTGPGSDRAVVFQEYALMPWMTARRNVEMAFEQFGLPRRERQERAQQALRSVGLAQAAQKYPSELSGGMRQRVALARALAAHPRVLLMDEPFGALDAITRIGMQRLLLELWEQTGTTVVFVTHDVDEALTLAQRLVLMAADPGRIVSDFDLVSAGIDTPAGREAMRETILTQLIPT